jgi:hypothetical protein
LEYFDPKNPNRAMTQPREARLKAQFAHLYPGLEPGVWYRAAWLSARQFARNPCEGDAASIARMLDEEHFDFRGGGHRRRPSGPQPIEG